MPVKFWHTSIRFRFFLSYLITTVIKIQKWFQAFVAPNSVTWALWVKTSCIYLGHDLSTISMANIGSLVSICYAHTTLLNVTRNSNGLNLTFFGPPKGWGNSSSLQKTYNGIEMLPNGRGSSEEWKVQLNLKLQSPEIRNSIGWSILSMHSVFLWLLYILLYCIQGKTLNHKVLKNNNHMDDPINQAAPSEDLSKETKTLTTQLWQTTIANYPNFTA